MYKVIDPDEKDVHYLHMFPIEEDPERHEFNQQCWCDPVIRDISSVTQLDQLYDQDDDQIEHVIIEHQRTDH